VQIAFIRRVYLSQNDTWLRRLFPFLRMEPSTPLAEAPIVVMTGTKSKKWMEDMIKAAFAARNVGHKHTRVGHDVVFRQGDPSDTHDLVRVAAHKVLCTRHFIYSCIAPNIFMTMIAEECSNE
jgi:hypothetical protein